jgi:hypothetical protein
MCFADRHDALKMAFLQRASEAPATLAGGTVLRRRSYDLPLFSSHQRSATAQWVSREIIISGGVGGHFSGFGVEACCLNFCLLMPQETLSYLLRRV